MNVTDLPINNSRRVFIAHLACGAGALSRESAWMELLIKSKTIDNQHVSQRSGCSARAKMERVAGV